MRSDVSLRRPVTLIVRQESKMSFFYLRQVLALGRSVLSVKLFLAHVLPDRDEADKHPCMHNESERTHS